MLTLALTSLLMLMLKRGNAEVIVQRLMLMLMLAMAPLLALVPFHTASPHHHMVSNTEADSNRRL